MANISQKEIYLANLDPVEGSEQGGKRPVVVVSGETTNGVFPIILVCPLTKVIKRIEHCPIVRKNKENKLSADSQALTFQIRAISKERLVRKIGSISEQDLRAVHQGILDMLRY
ncbi:MAG: transcription elongation factor GreAB [Candidatus Vogelbacteria bacterium CG10_big_fil_rev_8_21_14_0_10_45_14]|uniref:mRNA interferase n=1 Tax=Candidatus Vogelbacteria bacterium CG10_big_fil_rev_8_21_14_0_10_45_14 TaxID=1975042 RepID=A0A2H0RJ23_9BACT|nr:MAG: transcription elongation factor GreAB [Candidatus Vogelbacteria bacterium CG10_big_fil_rev_8_21_14_0_10_45_14]